MALWRIMLIFVLLCYSCSIVHMKLLTKNTVLLDDELDASELIDRFLERAKQNTRHHRAHRLPRRHRLSISTQQLTHIDAYGREYVKCRKSMPNFRSVIKRCYRPPSDDMRVGCYAVWDMKSEALVQDCWVQQAISMNNCGHRKCIADKSTFCCCYGHICNSRLELLENMSSSAEYS
ncbi:unnamed protein product [Thelazia callipaeda]|uniref:Activin_recp domain-containing protein n=1 Tax=Thelazia callipaeda TaxID=103827 RepID=A0A0N5CJG1_THECL|nr:unnamed protein product [Thelazia callipaeda]